MNFNGFRVLYYDSKTIVLDNIIWGLLQLGADVERSKLLVTLNEPNDEEIVYIRKEAVNYNCVVTQNFSVNVAIACLEECVPYISWVYDSPQVSLYTEHSKYPTNFIFVFDKIQMKRLKECGVNNVFHMPLAANMAYVSRICVSDSDRARLGADISFVGQLYRLNYFHKYIENASEDIRDTLKRITDEKALNWAKGSTIYNSFPPHIIQEVASSMRDSDFEYHKLIGKQFIEETMLLGPMVANRERTEILNLCGTLFKTSLYTSEKDIEYAKSVLQGVKIHGPARAEEPYKIYASSKLNLNLTLRTIESAVPQRVFDIMSMGGTVISNYQPEAEELFIPDKEIILFESPEEFADKAKFYLNHSSLRKKIGEAGCKKVRDRYNYVYALNSMFDTVMKIIG